MGKRGRRKQRAQAKPKRYRCPVSHIASAIFGFSGVSILFWSGISMGNPFPYAVYIGAFLFLVSLSIIFIYDKTSWIKGRQNYPNDLGGPGPGS